MLFFSLPAGTWFLPVAAQSLPVIISFTGFQALAEDFSEGPFPTLPPPER